MKTTTSFSEQSQNSQGPFFNKNGSQSSEESFFKPSFIQPKLSIGQVGDQYEQEADQMAEHVVNRSANSPAVQAKCAACEADDVHMKPALQAMEEEEEAAQMKPEIQQMEEEEEAAQMKPEIHRMHEEEEAAQMKPEVQAKEASPEFEQQLQATSGGQSLPSGTLSEMNQAFGADFSGVKVHNDNSAVQLSQDIGAQAFTHGSNIYFNQGKYNPDSSDGKKLLAHELTHTIHQGAVQEDKQ